ncbi:hypothetical protein, conserved [Leishmania tarentolae]|uniref:Leucine-rich repeat protein n=1 Tax=Leishmania tarentolae TaxID=5689 RepID=A0A640KW83_LEITA|nr:hypothetical protein, conserved [Leishmania tarentolae]
MAYHRLDLVNQGVESLEGLSERKGENFLVINLQRNRITSFEFFGTHPYLIELHLQHNRIESFRGLTKQVSLRSLHLQGCPVACHPYYRLMALLTIGFGLEEVDGLPISSQERHVAKALGKRVALAVSYGWLLDLHPRANVEYDAIIDELRRFRKGEYKRKQNIHSLSVEAALANLDQTHGRRRCNTEVELQLTEREKMITRLTRRVAQLECQLSTSPLAHTVALLPPTEDALDALDNNRVSSASGLFSSAELALMDTMSFLQGIRLRHNLGRKQGDFHRVCLQIDHETLTAVSFLSREQIVQLSLRSLRVRHVRPLTLVAEDPMGGTVELCFDSLALLQTVYKALFLFSARPMPRRLMITQSELQERERVHHRSPKALSSSASPPTSFAVSEVGPSTSWCTMPENPVNSTKAGTVTPALSASRRESGTPLMKHLETLDNVTDVPPLPAAYSSASAAGRSHSDLSVKESLRSRTAAVATEDNPTSEGLDVASENFVGASATEVDGAVSKPIGAVTKVAFPTQDSEGLAGLDSKNGHSESTVFQRGTDGQWRGSEEGVAVSEVQSSTKILPRVPPRAPCDAARTSGRTEAPALLRAPPRKTQAGRVSASSSVSDVRVKGGTGKAAAPRSSDRTSVGSSGTPGADSQKSSVVVSGRREGKHTSSTNFKGTVPDGGSVTTNTVQSSAKDTTRPEIFSRFRALLIDSDSDSGR